jgi:hypothetical protein
MRRLALLFSLVLSVLFADTKSEVVQTGKHHMEFRCPLNLPLELNVRSGEILIAGTDDRKITIDLAGRNADKIQDLKGRLSVDNHVAQLNAPVGPGANYRSSFTSRGIPTLPHAFLPAT